MNAKKRARRQVEALQRPLHEVDDLAHEPVRLVREQACVDREHRRR